MQSKQDTVVVGDYVNTIMEKVATTVKELHWVDTDSHHILKENTLNTWNILDEFILKQQ
jgi:esterase/lipase